MAQPENFAILQPLVAATLWLTARGLKGEHRLVSSPRASSSASRRSPGTTAFILGLAVGLVFVVGPWPGVAVASAGSAPRLPWRAAFGCFGLYLLVMGPWFAPPVS